MGFFHEVGEFFSELFGESKPKYIGFLRQPSTQDDKPNKRPKGQIGFKKSK